MVAAIYRLNADGSRESAQLGRTGNYALVDTRIPYDSEGCRSNLRNQASLAVHAHCLTEAALLLDLGYAIRVKTSSGSANYLTKKDLIIER